MPFASYFTFHSHSAAMFYSLLRCCLVCYAIHIQIKVVTLGSPGRASLSSEVPCLDYETVYAVITKRLYNDVVYQSMYSFLFDFVLFGFHLQFLRFVWFCCRLYQDCFTTSKQPHDWPGIGQTTLKNTSKINLLKTANHNYFLTVF